jgi:hypothetical protein
VSESEEFGTNDTMCHGVIELRRLFPRKNSQDYFAWRLSSGRGSRQVELVGAVRAGTRFARPYQW